MSEKAASLFVSARSADRRSRALEWLLARGRSERLVIAGASSEAANDLVREAAMLGVQTNLASAGSRAGPAAGFGWQRTSWTQLASTLAAPRQAALGLAPIGGLSLEALCARLLHLDESKARAEGRSADQGLVFDPSLPGAARALARTLTELRLAGISSEQLAKTSPALARLLLALERALSQEKFADRAANLRLASAAAQAKESELSARPLLLLDVQLGSVREEQFLRALAANAEVLAVAPEGDASSIARIAAALGTAPRQLPSCATSPLARLQRSLFQEDRVEEKAGEEGATAAGATAEGGALDLFSAPGEGRECVEIVRRIFRAAAGGVPFDRMAVLLRSPNLYRPLLEEALARAKIPAWFSRGTMRPDPSGRAFLALLACADEGLSARRFAEYLSLGELPLEDNRSSASSAGSASAVSAASGDELLASAIARAARGGGESGTSATDETGESEESKREHPRATWRWEPLLIDAAVIGGREVVGAKERWKRRLLGHRAEMLEREKAVIVEDEARGNSLRREREDLEALWTFAEPLLERLSAFPREANWGVWLDALDALAQASLRNSDQVRSLLAQLRPLASVGPVTLAEVQLLLSRELGELSIPPPARREGKLFVGPIDAARGLSFAHVFLPGLAERLFPPKALQDPLLRDRERTRLDPEHALLPVENERVADERLQLRLAAGAAEDLLVLSWPRLELQLGRARVPSFYALEALAAAEGKLPGFAELSRRAERAGDARAGWPAPRDPRHAIDDAEHDLSLLGDALHRPEEETRGLGRYLLGANPALRRAIYRRAERPRRKWFRSDGLVDPSPAALEALRPQQLDQRSFSASALQNYAACPYRFLLSAIHRLEPRKEPEAIDEIDPLSRGSLMHDTQFELFTLLQKEGALPLYSDDAGVAAKRLEHARMRLAEVIDRIARRYQDQLAPAIARVWEDCIASIKGDLREWLRRVSLEPRWSPIEFERAFGLVDRGARDARSRSAPVQLAGGLQLRGSIDLVEQASDGMIRATDYKSGKQRAQPGMVIKGGEVLQPVLYALALEQLFPQNKIAGGELFYCTHAGEFTEVMVPLDEQARDAEKLLASTVGDALRDGFFPAAPRAGECARCDYLEVCGEGEEDRIKKKSQERLLPLHTLRGRA